MPPDLKLIKGMSVNTEMQLWDAIQRIANFAQGNSLQLELLVRRQKYVIGSICAMVITNILVLVLK